MRISISNIAWDSALDEEVAHLLSQHGVDAVDIAPGKYWNEHSGKYLSNPSSARAPEIAALRDFWEKRGIELVGMQGLLFGLDYNIFGGEEDRKKLLNYLDKICALASGLGIKFLVFGSPKNRDRKNLIDDEVARLAQDFFRALGDRAAQHKVQICLEPNPKFYGANFMTNSAETAAMVRAIAHENIAMQLDTGSIIMNEEEPQAAITPYQNLFCHIHASDRELKPLEKGASTAAHRQLAQIIAQHLPDKIVTIEMRALESARQLAAIDTALAFTKEIYNKGG